jgi:hypothetical protein
VRPSGFTVIPSSWERAALVRVQQSLRSPTPKVWQDSISAPVVQHFRLLGRQLLAALRGALEQRRGQSSALEEVRKLGQEAANLLHQTGLPLRQALIAYFFFQSTLTEALAEVYPTDSEEARSKALRDLEVMLREWLLATMDAYEPASNDRRDTRTKPSIAG